jgi:hypothetical protein
MAQQKSSGLTQSLAGGALNQAGGQQSSVISLETNSVFIANIPSGKLT